MFLQRAVFISLVFSFPTFVLCEASTPIEAPPASASDADADAQILEVLAPPPPVPCEEHLKKEPHSFYYRLIRTLDSILPRPKPWVMPEASQAEMAAIFGDDQKTDSVKLRDLYEILLRERLRSLDPVTRFFSRRMAQDALKGHSIYSNTIGWFLTPIAGPHYNPIFNRSSLPLADGEGLPGAKAMVALHEVEHGIHRNTNPLPFAGLAFTFAKELFMLLPTPFSPLFVRTIEKRTLGAQWEYASRIPPEVRAKLITQFETEEANRVGISERILAASVISSGLVQRTRQWIKSICDTQFLPLEQQREEVVFQMTTFGIRDFATRDTLIQRAKLILSEQEFPLFKALAKGGWKNKRALKTLKPEVTRWGRLMESDPQIQIEFLSTGQYEDYVKLVQEVIQFIPPTLLAGDWKNVLAKIYYFSLKYAHLSKEEFIAKVGPFHNYALEQLYRRHYLWSPFKWMIFSLSVVQITLGLYFGTHVYVPAVDFQALIELLYLVFGSGQ